jgi:hypothetical protein
MNRQAGTPQESRTLRLEDLERAGRGGRTRFHTRLADASGAERYELVVAGPRATVERVLAGAEIDVAIDPKADKREWKRHFGPAWREEQRARGELASLENVPELFKKKLPPAPTAERSVFVSLRALEPDGTRYLITVRNFLVPRFAHLFFPLPLVCSTFGVLRPSSGDQDLFLHLRWPPVAAVGASTRGGTLVDVVTLSVFCTPFTQFGPIFHVFGFTSGTCSSFTFGGADFLG